MRPGDRSARWQEWWLRDRLRRHRGPIVLGPWRGELGFEALYWLPWLSWLLRSTGVTPDRVYVISRGGAGTLYGVADDHVLDLYALRSPKEIRYQAHLCATKTGALKQYQRTAWDDNVLEQACAIWRLTRPLVIHPSVLYRRCDAYWGGRQPLEDILRRTRWDRLTPPPLAQQALPPKYYVARLYLRATLQADPHFLRQFCTILTALTHEAPVVVLAQPHHLDDHVDLPIPDLPRVFRCPAVPPEQTLAQHAAVIGRAAGFVGTYGGMAQLALRFGVPSISFYQDLKGTFLTHLLLSQAIATYTHVAFTPVRIADIPLWQAAMGGGHASTSAPGAVGIPGRVVGDPGAGSDPRPADSSAAGAET